MCSCVWMCVMCNVDVMCVDVYGYNYGFVCVYDCVVCGYNCV